MDAVCDSLLLEEILPRVAPKNLLRLGATSRRYNALVRSPGFRRRYWCRAGVFLDLARDASGVLPRFLSSSHAPEKLVVLGDGDTTNLALFPSSSSSSARTTEELAEASLSSSWWRTGVVVVAAHSTTGGLLLCAKGRPTSRSAQYYVCNPVTRQRVVLPELRSSSLCYDPQCALLTTVANCTAGSGSQFQVVVIEQWQMEDAYLRLKVFSSGAGQWESTRISLSESSLPFEHDFRPRPVLGQSGAAYWLQPRDDTAIAYHSASDAFQVIALPRHLASRKRDRVIGERHGGGGSGGGGLRFAQSHASVLEVWEWNDSQTTTTTTTTTRIARDAWTLLHRVGIAELLERNPEAAAAAGQGRSHVTPVGFHPTDVDVVFLELPWGVVVAYSMEHGTMNLQCTHNGYGTSVNLFPYVHPPYPVQIPAINNNSSPLALPRKRKAGTHE
ncbi:hypothetical protein BDA96_03G211200 [Sorghum bicolor]|uniref:F-box protein At3g26010-like beta-propeller domain-containing protein n=1 Tax=Sorghum bicolor TaxID=4558 RepID=A0A921RDQ0_SORBI|nr:hypothetical protein BDA96_03G211200 [Sorghum bicolor]